MNSILLATEIKNGSRQEFDFIHARWHYRTRILSLIIIRIQYA